MFDSAFRSLARTVALGVGMVVGGFTIGARQARAIMFDSCAPENAASACWWAASCTGKCVKYTCTTQTCGSSGTMNCIVCEDET